MAIFVGILTFFLGIACGMAFKDLLIAQIKKVTKKNS